VTKNFKDVYTHYAAISSKYETFALQVAYAWVGELLFKMGGTSANKKTRKFL